MFFAYHQNINDVKSWVSGHVETKIGSARREIQVEIKTAGDIRETSSNALVGFLECCSASENEVESRNKNPVWH